MLNIYKSSLALKINLKNLCNRPKGTHDSHLTYIMMLWSADVNRGFVIRNAEFQRLVYLANALTTLHTQGAKQMHK
jgi:hypothetical protein